MRSMVRIVVLLGAFTLISCSTAGAAPPRETPPKSIILIIGDGMGVAHFTAAQILRGTEFQIGRLPVTGLVTTRSANSIVTESAASATAYATGIKTNDLMVSVDPDGKPHQTVVELAESRGMATGLVTTTWFWDATLAAFAAHARSRREAQSIVGQMLRAGIDLIASTGVEKFGVEGNPPLAELAAQTGYALVRTAEELQTVTGPKILAVFRSAEQDGDSPDVALPALAAWAIERLARDPDGFFLLLEHEGTDTSAHDGSTPLFESSLRSLDETVGVALRFADARSDVLVIVTGDHETGGLQLLGQADQPLQLKWTTRGHTGEAIPIFSKGPGAGRFSGMIDNSDVGKALLSLVRTMGAGK